MSLAAVAYPVAATVLSGAVTWRFCLRPMRDGQHCDMASTPATEPRTRAESRAAEVAALRAEVGELSRRAQAAPR